MQFAATGVFLPLMQRRAMSNSCKMLLLLLLLPLQSRKQASQARGTETLASPHALALVQVMSIGDLREGEEGVLRATHPRGLVVLAADLDDRRVVRVEVEVVPLDGAQDLLGQRFFRLALEDERQVHDQ